MPLNKVKGIPNDKGYYLGAGIHTDMTASTALLLFGGKGGGVIASNNPI